MSDIVVRKAAPEELAITAELKRQIHELHVQGRPDLFAPMQNFEVYATHALEKDMHLIVAQQDEKLLGYALICYVHRPASPYMNERKFVHVEEFCVDEACHRRGVGRKMMEAIRQEAKQNGCPRIELDVWAFNEGARQFYEAVGFNCFRYFMEMNV